MFGIIVACKNTCRATSVHPTEHTLTDTAGSAQEVGRAGGWGQSTPPEPHFPAPTSKKDDATKDPNRGKRPPSGAKKTTRTDEKKREKPQKYAKKG